MTPAVKMTGSSPDRDSVDPDSGMRVLGAVQINIGILVFVLGVVDLILTMTSHDRDLKSYGSHYQTVVTLTTLSSPLWSGLWFSITGALAACFTYGRPATVLYSKMALLVTSLLCCALFGPACAVINGFISYTRHNMAKGDYQWLISLIVCFLAIIEVVMATVTTSVTCCCSTFSSTQVHVFVNPRKLSRSGSDVSIVTKSSTVSEKVDKNNSHVVVRNFVRSNTNRKINVLNPRDIVDTPAAISRDFRDGWTQVTQVGTRTANVGSSENNFVQLVNQTSTKDTNRFPQQTTIPVIKDRAQLLPQSNLTPVNVANKGDSLPLPHQTSVQSHGDDASQRSSKSSVHGVIMITPVKLMSRSLDTNLGTEPLGQPVKETSVRTVQPDLSSHKYNSPPVKEASVTTVPSNPSSHQYNSPPVSEARERLSSHGMTWTPDRHLRSQPPSLPTRPSSTDQTLQPTASYLTLKKLALPNL